MCVQRIGAADMVTCGSLARDDKFVHVLTSIGRREDRRGDLITHTSHPFTSLGVLATIFVSYMRFHFPGFRFGVLITMNVAKSDKESSFGELQFASSFV